MKSQLENSTNISKPNEMEQISPISRATKNVSIAAWSFHLHQTGRYNADIKSKATSKPARIMSSKCCEKLVTATGSTSKFCSVSCREAVAKQKSKQKIIQECITFLTT